MARDILIVDDEADIRLLMAGILGDEGYTTREAANSTEALAALQQRRPNLIILDIWLQGSAMDGLALLDAIKRDHADLPIIMISGHGNIETAVAAIKRGAYDFIEKPFKADRLLLIVDRAIEAAKLRRENEELRLRGMTETALVGNAPAIITVKTAIERVAPTNSRVLITGPAGSGKEVAARWLHSLSRRAMGPFIMLNCATMHPDRLESELFGVDQDGQTKTGTLELAHGGTLFLDEVCDMPLETQGKIVRTLQEQSFERIGGRTAVAVDVRVIASSNRDLAAEMAAGRFRQDLYYRLNVVPIRLPSLAERRSDIPELCDYFLQRLAQLSGLPPRRLGDDALAALQAYSWPGNVRQLRNVLERLLILAPGDVQEHISAEMLPPEVTGVAPAALGNQAAEIIALPLREARELFERNYLDAQVTRFGGNISRTAAFIGMERSALHRKLRSLGLVNERGNKIE